MASVALTALGWLWWRACSPLVAHGAVELCLAGVVCGDILAAVALGNIQAALAWRPWCLTALGWLWCRASSRLVACETVGNSWHGELCCVEFIFSTSPPSSKTSKWIFYRKSTLNSGEGKNFRAIPPLRNTILIQ